MTDLLALLLAAVIAIALVRWLARIRPIDPAPSGRAASPAALLVAACLAMMAAAAADISTADGSSPFARNALLLLTAILAVLAATRWAERMPRSLGFRHRLLRRDIPTVAAACALMAVGALRLQHGAPAWNAAFAAAIAAVAAGSLPAVYAAARLRGGRHGGGLEATITFAVVLALALSGALPRVA